MKSSLNANFDKWAKSFSGVDGGNPQGKIWLCGIEWGGAVADDPAEMFKTPIIDVPRGFGPEVNTKYPFNVKFLKLIAGMTGKTADSYWEIAAQSPHPFHPDSNYFKLNLFPLSFPKDRNNLWSPALAEATGLPSKSSYRAWCREHRFPVFKTLIDHFKPELVITVGSGYRSDFFQAFLGGDPETQSFHTIEVCQGRKLHWQVAENGETLAVNLPFLGGPSGLNSNHLLESFGVQLRRLLDAELRTQRAA